MLDEESRHISMSKLSETWREQFYSIHVEPFLAPGFSAQGLKKKKLKI